MPKFKQIKFKGFQKFFGGIVRFLCERALFTFFLFLLLSFLFSSYIYYQYSILTERTQLEAIGQSVKFNKSNYEEVLNIWQERDKKFHEVGVKEYPELFK